MRCFVAIDLPSPVRNHLVNVLAPLRDRFDVKWVWPDHMHLTLAFAGDLADAQVDALIEVVRALELPPLSLALTGFGWFPPRGIPRVLWAGVGGEGLDALIGLQAELAAGAEPLGVPREKRGFTPHITLGRVKSRFGALALLDALTETQKQLNTRPFLPPALVLYRSRLLPAGPEHEPLLYRPLSPDPD